MHNDTGGGNALNVQRTVKDLIAAGAAGCFLEFYVKFLNLSAFLWIKLGQRSVVRVHSFCFVLDSNEQGIDNDPFFRFLFGISLTLLIVSLLVLSQLGHMHGKQIIPAEEHAAKIASARDAIGDSDFVLVARTDA
ncbi:hypothetical protein KPL71_016359 [Citrus sinensis]|uniref:Uncharacterized protein n=1 Tax=Citrus sinensis TaxID=2711 RepID=A0ACB8KSP9_CITSI|nr:hypothetical protein KPL71_016359 [Citrus sinensis]